MSLSAAPVKLPVSQVPPSRLYAIGVSSDIAVSDLLAENEQLEARAKASEKGKMKDTMERAKLESELKDIQRLVDRIPPEVLAELKRQQRHTRER